MLCLPLAISIIITIIKHTVKFRLLEDLDFANVDVVQRVDALTVLLNVLANTVWNSTILTTTEHEVRIVLFSTTVNSSHRAVACL